MTETFYRLHSNPTAPEFSAENAYSGLWGSAWTADGSQTECHDCGGDKQLFGEDCDTCDGTGYEDAQYGYSCCWSASDLVKYMTEHGIVSDSDTVVIFDGQMVGTGFDGEPLAVPTGEIRWTTWAELLRLAETENADA